MTGASARSTDVGHVQTTLIRRQGTLSVEHDQTALDLALRSARQDQILTVVLAGPTGVGKSSLIANLTGDREIVLGDGFEETTEGVWTYGPYTLNSLRTRWGLEQDPASDCKVFFFDTQGFEGHTMGLHNENMLFSNMVLCPYLSSSNMCILMHQGRLERGTAESFSFLMGTVNAIRADLNGSSEHQSKFNIVDVVTCVSQYNDGEDFEGRPIQKEYNPETSQDSFEAACAYVKSVTERRINGFFAHDFYPLPSFFGQDDIFHQNGKFNSGFEIVARRLLETLDTSRRSEYIDGVGFLHCFHACEERVKARRFDEMTSVVRIEAERESLNRCCDRVTDELFNSFYRQVIDAYFDQRTSHTSSLFAEYNLSFTGASQTDEVLLRSKLTLMVSPTFPPDTLFLYGTTPFDEFMNSPIIKSIYSSGSSTSRLIESKARKLEQVIYRHVRHQKQKYLDSFRKRQMDMILAIVRHELKSLVEGQKCLLELQPVGWYTPSDCERAAFSFTDRLLTELFQVLELDDKSTQATVRAAVQPIVRDLVDLDNLISREKDKRKRAPTCNIQ